MLDSKYHIILNQRSYGIIEELQELEHEAKCHDGHYHENE
jgi:hypothetical protein